MKTFINFKKNLIFLFSLGTIIILLAFTSTYKESVIEGIDVCCNVLLPSLFPFFFLSSFVIYTNCFQPIAKHLGFVSKIFGVSKNGLIAILLCLVGGFPVGGKAIATLYSENKITESEAKILSYCLVGAGPGFLVTFVGENLFCNKTLGIYLLFANYLSVLLITFLNCKILNKRSKKPYIYNSIEKSSDYSLGESIVNATESSIKSSLSMCGFVIIFIVSNNLLKLLPIHTELISIILEITSGVINCNHILSIEGVAFFIGFGGICVHFQIFGIIKDIHINKVFFFLMRVLQGLISYVVMFILLKIFPISAETFESINKETTVTVSSTIWGSFALIFLSLIFLVSINHKNNQEVNLCAE